MKYVKLLMVCCFSAALLVSCSTQAKNSQQVSKPTQQANAGQTQEQPKQDTQQDTNKQQEEQKKETTNQQGESPSTQSSSNQQSNATNSVAAPTVQASSQSSQSQSQQASSSASASPAPAPPQKNVATLSIRSDSGMILGTTEVEVQGSDTVFTILSRTVKSKGIQMESEGVGPSAYVMGINNLYEKDRGPRSGWMYRVNGVYLNVSAGAASVKNGDKIEWVYTTNGEKP
ncbi:DUF4430 domain-containing protein [Ectobacillus sp. sgz5001026]|uniref:DUF4430 domain-containing protein n=1 Tax=Ectobacillus sp. sgz5001026 TaxID=3242473 RepID=UPI0036D3750A